MEPILGENFAAKIAQILEQRAMLIATVRRQLGALVDDDLIGGFLPGGRANTEELQSKQKSWQMDARKFGQSNDPFELAGLGNKDMLADYPHWSLSAYFTIDEVLFLSVGLEPSDDFKSTLQKTNDGRKPKAEVAFLLRRKDILTRQFSPVLICHPSHHTHSARLW